MNKSMYNINKKCYDDPATAKKYDGGSLIKAEEAIISSLTNEISESVLDIGVGPGRTTPYLSALSNNYVGIDYSIVMLKPCKAKYRDASLALCDAKALCFEDESFNVIYFCWNAIDEVNHEDRLIMLSEIHRVLKAGGAFFFSCHNLNWKAKSAYKFPGFASSRNAVELIKRNTVLIGKYFFGIINHLKYRKFEKKEPTYSIINEAPYDYRKLTYFITQENQVSQLEEMGFGQVELVRMDGSPLDINEYCDDPWIFYVARKEIDS
jgi:ubiquinone/menaquinone biosynthesis C-methylase UbiE